ncbi:triose-phosphate isomerase [Picrophilus oshimae]|uniref:Triosephosphate isomerase n=1 Tax=Picrophilus torridus (strain ATCC 700027 / DSM 9790 / JCM 10055 / NBRC 100828 / KAW 2/3) TaxID=1122961 RepID=A0A8G2FWF0_PICTO|nr:triose-phosphate isomerase [Picrophilus oshimae]SMD30752.1 triosephosphate isomerase [Picrophilus oshimae DSM 9789]
MKPLIFINFKHYENATGRNAELLLNEFRKIKDQKNIYYCLGPGDLRLSLEFPDLNIYSQHVDYNGYGPYTGSISMNFLKSINVNGSLLNHSEKRLEIDDIRKTIEYSKSHDFKLVVCAENIDEIKSISKLRPDYIAYEPRELIGGDISVSNAKPDIIRSASVICSGNDVKLLVGAGIKTENDIKASINLGASGVLIASGVIKDPKPINKLISLTGNITG